MSFEQNEIPSKDEQEVAQMWAEEAGSDYNGPADTKAEGSTDDPEAGKQAQTTEEPSDAPADTSASTTETVTGKSEDDLEIDFTPPAWIQLLPEDVRQQATKEFKESRSNVKANAVRVRALSEHLEQTRAKLAAAEQAGSQVPKFELPKTANIDEMRKDFPEIAEWLETAVAALAEQTNRHNQAVLNPLREAVQVQTNALATTVNEANSDHVEQARQQVLRVVPDAAEIARSTEFANWLSHQSPGIQKMRRSEDPSDNITLFTLYKGSRPKPSDKLKEHAELPKKGGSVVQQSDDDVDDPMVFWNREFAKK
jgi:hypothetical protein